MKKFIVNSRIVPVFRDSGYVLEDASGTAQAFEAEKDHPHLPGSYIYSRYRNPTVTAVEDQLAALESAAWSLLTQSGMSAIDTALSLFQPVDPSRPLLFFSEIYGGTNSYIDKVLEAQRGIPVYRFVTRGERHNIAELTAMLEKYHPSVVYFETVSNPMLIVADTKEIIAAAKAHGASVVVDNTFATSYLWKPLDEGVDLVVHSGTKYLSGHGNLSAGIISGNDPELMKRGIEYRKLIGHMISPDDASRLDAFLKTFTLRMKRHCTNAAEIAKMLHDHPAIDRVLYPGLEDHPTHGEALKLFGRRGFGGMVTFDMAGSSPVEKARLRDRFIRSLREDIRVVPTLGDTDTILLPIQPVWGDKYDEPGMIRLSAGLEETAPLVARIKKGLDNKI